MERSVWWTIDAALAGPESAVLANGSFEDGLSGWSTVVGANSGASIRPSEHRVAQTGRAPDGDHVLVLSGDAETTRWYAVAQDVAAAPGQRIRLTGAVRTRDVRREDGQFENCHLHVLFRDEAGERLGVAAAPCPDDNSGWSPIEVEGTVPPDTARTTVGLFLSMSGTASFDDLRLTVSEQGDLQPPHASWPVMALRDVDVRFAPDSGSKAEIPAIAIQIQSAWTDLLGRTGITAGYRPTVHLYDSAEQAEALVDHELNFAWPVLAQTHQMMTATPGHELAHVATHRAWGSPPSAFLSEGTAVWLDGASRVHDRMHEERATHDVPALAELIGDFRDHDGFHTYAVAGSFVAWLVEVHGLQVLQAIWLSTDPVSALTEQLGQPIDTIEAAWISETRG